MRTSRAAVTLAAGPKSLHEGAGTDGGFKAEIFSYARAAGLFAGVSVQEPSLQPDRDAIRAVYGLARTRARYCSAESSPRRRPRVTSWPRCKEPPRPGVPSRRLGPPAQRLVGSGASGSGFSARIVRATFSPSCNS